MQYMFKNSIIFAKFTNKNERELLICVDKHMNLLVFDAMKLKYESTSIGPLTSINLFDECRFFDLQNIKAEDASPMVKDPQE